MARGLLAAAALSSWACWGAIAQCAAAPEAAFLWHLPRGFPTPAVPADNPMSEAKVKLGRRLFFDARLSLTGSYSCGSCHDPALAYTDGRAVAVGATGDRLPHSAMSLVNVAYNISFGWTNSRLRSLEAQMLEPMLNEHPIELGMKGREHEVISALEADQSYRSEFAAAFTEPALSFDHLVKAIASFERTLIAGDSPFDRYVFGGKHDALSPQAKRGMALFFSPRAGCASCHSGFNFSGNWRDTHGDTGKPSFATNGTSEQPTRVPTLRNVALTAPYMHDGRFPTLDAVLDHYAQVAERLRTHASAGMHARKRSGGIDPRLGTFDLTPEERTQLITFLHSLTSGGE